MERVLPGVVVLDTESELERLLAAEWTGLVRLARSIVGDTDAEDVVQEGFVIAWQKRGSLRDQQALRPWVTRIVLRRCFRRARRRRPSVALVDAPEPSTEDAPDVDVPRVLALLAPRQRAVMHLTIIEERTDGEIASLLGIRAATVRAHRRRARERLRALFGEEICNAT